MVGSAARRMSSSSRARSVTFGFPPLPEEDNIGVRRRCKRE